VKCSVGKWCKRGVMGRVYMGGKVVRSEGLGVRSVCAIWWEKNIRNYIQYFLHLALFSLRAFLRTVFVLRLLSSYVYLLYLMCICCTLCVFVVPYVYLLYLILYLLYYVCIVAFTLDARLLARSKYLEGPATGHLDTGFSWFHCVYKRMLRWFPSFQVATTCLSCSPPDLNFLASFFFFFCVHAN
jgi:hypothetical protein